MAHFAVVCPEDAGHLLSIGPVAKELVRRGHRLTILGRSRGAPLAEKLGLELYELDLDSVPDPSSLPLWLAFRLVGANGQIEMRNWFRWQAEAVLQLAPPALKKLNVDGVIVDQIVSAGGTAAEMAGVPFVTICSALLWNEDPSLPPSYTAWPYAAGRRAALRNRLGYAGWALVSFGQRSTSSNHYRRRANLPRFRPGSTTHFHRWRRFRSCARNSIFRVALCRTLFTTSARWLPTAKRHATISFPWDRLDGRPLMFASLGTVADPANVPVFRRILAACAGLDAQLVLGPWQVERRRGTGAETSWATSPDNALVVDFAPQLALLDRAALLITHAGRKHGARIAQPRSADGRAASRRPISQPWPRASPMPEPACSAPSGTRTPLQIRTLVQRVLADKSFQHRAKDLRAAMLGRRRTNPALRISPEQALLTRRPVVRP